MAFPSPRGSSPLTRGKLAVTLTDLPPWGLIPTHAGKTPPANMPRRASWAHPHSRGENTSHSGWWGLISGSSPLTRGKPGLLPDGDRRRGLIPTHAGKTLSRLRRPGLPAAHPHSRGENVISPFAIASLKGSSPLTRGKLDKVRGHQGHGGLIPTHAGKTEVAATFAANHRAHPHSRGENAPARRRKGPCGGSSPLTRGKRAWTDWWSTAPRLIPTHAGKTRNCRI